MVSLCSPTPAEGSKPQSPPRDVVLVADLGNPAAADYAAYVSRHGGNTTSVGEGVATSAVVFLGPRLTEVDRRALDGVLAGVERGAFIGIVSTFQAHIGECAAE